MPWAILLRPTVLLGIALAAASGFGYLQTVRLGAAQDRIVALRGEYAVRDRQAQEEADKRLQAAQTRVLEAERKSAKDVAAISTKLEAKRVKDLARKDAVIAELRSGARVFHDPGSTDTGCRNPDSPASPGSGQHNDPPAGQLSGAAAEFLFSLAAESDEIVEQLTACQAIVISDRSGL